MGSEMCIRDRIKLVEVLGFAGLDTRSSLKVSNRKLSVNWKLRVDRYATSIPLPCALAIRDRVISPYSPYNVIDVKGFRSGQLAKDPSNGKIFRIP